MIARIWKGAVRRADTDAYAAYMRETGVPGYATVRYAAQRSVKSIGTTEIQKTSTIPANDSSVHNDA